MKTKILMIYSTQFLLSVALCGLVSLCIIKITILNPLFIIHEFKQENYYQAVYDGMNNSISNYMIQSGLPNEVLNDIYTMESIKKDVNNNIFRLCSGKRLKINTNYVKKNLNQNIQNYLEEENIQISNQESLNRFTDQIVGEYKAKLDLNNYLNVISKKIKIINILIYIGIIILVVIILFLYWLWKHCLRKKVTVIPLFTTAFILIFGYWFTKENIDINHLLIWDKNVSMVLINIIWQFLQMVKIISIFLFLIALVMSILNQRNIKCQDYCKNSKIYQKKLKNTSKICTIRNGKVIE